MKIVAAAQFKAQCLSLLDSVGPEGIVITKHGRPVARSFRSKRGQGGSWGPCADTAHEIIAATSVVHGIPLLTRDRKIRASRLVPLA